jgi:alpha-beta hydrolase superfamily lysophospholipase
MVHKERRLSGDVPLIIALPENPIGWVLFLHGAGGSKERTARLAAPFHEQNLATVHPDAPLHGERAEDRWRFDPKDFPNYLEGVVLAISTQVAELPGLVGRLRRLPELANLPLLASGASMGGYVWHELISRRLLRPQAAAILISSGFPLQAPHDFLEKRPDLAEAYHNPPVTRTEAYPPTPLIHLHGDRDPVVPLRQMQETIAALRPAYKERDGRLAQVVFADVGHELPETMLNMAAAWLSHWSR